MEMGGEIVKSLLSVCPSYSVPKITVIPKELLSTIYRGL